MTPSPSPAAPVQGEVITSLSGSQLPWALGFLILALTLAAAVVLMYRRGYFFHRGASRNGGSGDGQTPDPDSTLFVRSLLALWLVIGLLGFTLVSFGLTDTTLRSTLVGGLTASTGAAVAYYFSSKAADDARRDILTAIPGLGGSVAVPDFAAHSLGQAQSWFAGQRDLLLKVDPAQATDRGRRVVAQSIPAETRVLTGTTITLTVGPAAAQVTATRTATGDHTLTWPASEGATEYRVRQAGTRAGLDGATCADTAQHAMDVQAAQGSWVRVDARDAAGNVAVGEPLQLT